MSDAFYEYEMVEERWILKENERVSYGIAVYREDPGGTAVPITVYHDITPDRNRLFELIRQCNLLHLSPLHLRNVIEDFLETDEGFDRRRRVPR